MGFLQSKNPAKLVDISSAIQMKRKILGMYFNLLHRAVLVLLLTLAGAAWGQLKRYGILAIDGHGTAISSAYINYLRTESQRMLNSYRALGMRVNKDFHFKIHFFANKQEYVRYGKERFGDDNEGALGVTYGTLYTDRRTGKKFKPPYQLSTILCYYNAEKPAETIPTLIHEMGHAVINGGYGFLPKWLSEGFCDWFASRPQHVGLGKKFDDFKGYNRLKHIVDAMTIDEFIQMIAATEYSEWDKLFAKWGFSRAAGYRLSEALVDLMMSDLKVSQPAFIKALAYARVTSKYSKERTLACAKYIQSSWPGGLPRLLSDWKVHYASLATPKRSDKYAAAVRANRQRILDLARKQGVTQFEYVTQWLVLQRFEMENLRVKGLAALRKGEIMEIRRRTAAIQEFAQFDYDKRWPPIDLRRKNMLKNFGRDRKDPGYLKAIPFRDVRQYLGIHPGGNNYPLPPFDPNTHLPLANFRWQNLDPQTAALIYQNLRQGYRKPVPPVPKVSATSTDPLEAALARNPGKPLDALKSIGAKVTLGPLGDVDEVDLSGTKVMDQSLIRVMEQFYPERLNLAGTDITDKGLSALLAWTHLKEVKLGGTRVTQKKINTMKFLCPHLEVVR